MLPPQAQDHRRSTEAELIASLRARDPLALAEAYHRSVPAAHAVARRLMPSTADVEALLLRVYHELWSSPPDAAPLERWARQRTWALGAEELRRRGDAASSPSAAGLLPDLPAPDVRYLDAAERALSELPDEQRRALLAAHDQGTPSTQQGGGDAALRGALLALAGPETSSTDRQAVEGDACADVEGFGDWCLGLADAATTAAVEAAIEARPGCAALGRALRRGRRRIEGLPATPDMGHRVLVSVLAASPAPLIEAAGPGSTAEGTRAPAQHGRSPAAAPAAAAAGSGGPPPIVGGLFDSDTDELAAMREAEEDLPFVGEGGGAVAESAADAPGGQAQPRPSTGTAPMDETQRVAPRSALDDVHDEDTPWQRAPETVSTGELRLSEILADAGEDDPVGSAGGYASLRELTADQERGSPAPPAYELDDEDDEELPRRSAGSGLALALAWVLPILAGGAIGLLIAILFVGT